MRCKWIARLRYWWLTGRRKKRPKRHQANGWPIYPVISTDDLLRLAGNQRSRGKW